MKSTKYFYLLGYWEESEKDLYMEEGVVEANWVVLGWITEILS